MRCTAENAQRKTRRRRRAGNQSLTRLDRPSGRGDHVDGLDEPVTVKEISWPQTDAPKKLINTQIKVENLRDCQDHGWSGPGLYILPLVMEGMTYRAAAIPPSPGLSRGAKPRIYRATPETRAQLRQIRKPNG